ncbi:hypothetical protein [Mesorhizobium sp. M1B.F.Ca.ET.045.04.1.1]|uniref:hypothetical protein n=1 Tax=Mesorhizobium sp. M1B.F.Ca.ET.045.04.1.1 TaxID=2493673 RepID=UPI000F75055B|nr:hypothetical protein [Mesorhizobium sp. M1B.F.Ca.ET.045.04.1.1]AZO30978.1 hypothetical protein EJ071_28685 [Mesorhizobium sp. M1B.F.Ca.ET.045.04.1.1]
MFRQRRLIGFSRGGRLGTVAAAFALFALMRRHAVEAALSPERGGTPSIERGGTPSIERGGTPSIRREIGQGYLGKREPGQPDLLIVMTQDFAGRAVSSS